VFGNSICGTATLSLQECACLTCSDNSTFGLQIKEKSLTIVKNSCIGNCVERVPDCPKKVALTLASLASSCPAVKMHISFKPFCQTNKPALNHNYPLCKQERVYPTSSSSSPCNVFYASALNIHRQCVTLGVCVCVCGLVCRQNHVHCNQSSFTLCTCGALLLPASMPATRTWRAVELSS